MARSLTIAQLRTQCRQRADFETGAAASFVPDAELDQYINNSLAQLYELIIDTHGELYFSSSSAFPTVVGTGSYALPADFFRLISVEMTDGNATWLARQFPYPERMRFSTEPGRPEHDSWGYVLQPATVILVPTPRQVLTVTLRYIPDPPILSGATTFNFYGGWEEWLVADVAIKLYAKEESDPTIFVMERQQQEARIRANAPKRDNTGPAVIADAVTAARRARLWRW